MNDPDAAEFVKECRGIILGGDFTALLRYCESHRDALEQLSGDERAQILRTNQINAVRPSYEGVRVLFSDPAHRSKMQAQLARDVFEKQDYFLQQALLFHGVDLGPARRAYALRENPPDDEERTRAAYAKLKEHTGIGREDVPACSRDNINRLRSELGQLTLQEQAFYDRVQQQYDQGGFCLWHESSRGTGSNKGFRSQIAQSKTLYSSDELQRIKAAKQLELLGVKEIPGGQTYDLDREVIGNTDFVFFNLRMGNPFDIDRIGRTSMAHPLITMPRDSMLISEGWLGFAKAEIDREKAEAQHGADKLSELERRDRIAFEEAVRPFRKSEFDTEAAKKTIFSGDDIPKAIALLTISAMRQVGKPGAPKRFEEMQLTYGDNAEADRKIIQSCSAFNELLVPNRVRVSLLSNGRNRDELDDSPKSNWLFPA